jgi:hypothetical protein
MILENWAILGESKRAKASLQYSYDELIPVDMTGNSTNATMSPLS